MSENTQQPPQQQAPTQTPAPVEQPKTPAPQQQPLPKIEPQQQAPTDPKTVQQPAINADHPDVKAILEAQKKAWEKEATEAARRQKMDELERIKLEATEAKTAAEQRAAELAQIKTSRELWQHMSQSTAPKVQPGAAEMVEMQVQKFLAASPGKTVADAVAALQQTHGFLFAAAQTQQAPTQQQQQQTQTQGPPAPLTQQPQQQQAPLTTTPLAHQQPTQAPSKHPRDMTPAEYAAYKKSKGLSA